MGFATVAFVIIYLPTLDEGQKNRDTLEWRKCIELRFHGTIYSVFLASVLTIPKEKRNHRYK